MPKPRPRLLALVSLLAWALVAAAAQAQIRVGVSWPETGPAATAAQWERWGLELAAEEINAAGGVLGQRLLLVYADNRCNPSEAVGATNRLLQERVVAIVGAHCSSATIAAMPLIQQARVPMITGISSSPRITELSGRGGNDYMFRIQPSDLTMMEGLAAYLARARQFARVAVLAEDSDFGRGGAQAFATQAERAGVQVISQDFHPQQLADYTTILTRLQSRRPDAIALFQLGNDQANFMRNYQQMGLRIPFTGRVELGGLMQRFIEAGVMENSVSVWPYSPEVDSPGNRAFAEKIRTRHNATPYLQTWASYDSLRLIAQALAEAGSADGPRLRDAMAALRFQNVMGPVVRFDEHNQAGTVLVVQRVRDRRVEVAEVIDLSARGAGR
jgi:branched-chain amino acid transport system substrate-binding protein